MSNQGFTGALIQYFTIEDKPRLNRRNTWFRDNFRISEAIAIRFIIVFVSVAIAFIIYGMLGLLL